MMIIINIDFGLIMNKLFCVRGHTKNNDQEETEPLSFRDIFVSQAQSVFTGSWTTRLFALWENLNMLVNKEELEYMKQKYHLLFMKN